MKALSLVGTAVLAVSLGCASGGETTPAHQDLPPVAQILAPAAETLQIWAGDSVSFLGTCSDDHGGAASPRWTLEGGAPASSASAGVDVLFASTGTFTATYECVDATALASERVTRTIVVAPVEDLHWFVDSERGSDANDGAAPSRPLRTIGALLAKSLAAGSTINLARGSRWREQLAGLPSEATVQAYGSGARPILDASDVAANASFSKTVGRTNVYEIAWAHELDAPGKVKHSAWEDGLRLLRVASLTDCDATPGSFFAAGVDAVGKTDTIHVHPRGSTNPNTDGKLYELARRKYGVWGISPGIRVIGVHTRRNGHNDGSLGAVYARDSICEDGTVHNCWNAGIFEDVTAWKSEGTGPWGSWTLFIHYTDGAGPGVVYRRCRAVGSSATGGVGYYSHTAGAAKHDEVRYESCSAAVVDVGFGGTNAKNIVITDARTYRVVQAITATAESVAIAGGIFNGYTTGSPLMSRFFSPATPPGAAAISDVAVVARASSGALIYGVNGSSLDVSRSTFAFTGHVGFPFTVLAGGSMTLAWRNNVAAGSYQRHFDLSGTTTLTAASNVYTAGQFAVSGVSYGSFEAYAAGVAPQEGASVVADPVFSGSLVQGDVTLAAGSPARALGAGAPAPSHVLDQAYWDGLAAVTP